MNPTTRKTAELTLIRATYNFSGPIKPSRKKGLFEKLQKFVDKDLEKLTRIPDAEVRKAEAAIREFGNQTGWLDNPKHVGTLLSFCACIIEESEFVFNPKILETINEIITHFEDRGDLKTQSCWAGSLAAEKWENLFKDEVAA